jgi:hypothetical protein
MVFRENEEVDCLLKIETWNLRCLREEIMGVVEIRIVLKCSGVE